MSDSISRQDAIDAIRKFQTYKLFEKDNMLLVDQAEVMTELMMLPSADRPTGEWIKSNILPHGWHCSHCDAPVMTDDISEMLFCPNCGARMYKGGAE